MTSKSLQNTCIGSKDPRFLFPNQKVLPRCIFSRTVSFWHTECFKWIFICSNFLLFFCFTSSRTRFHRIRVLPAPPPLGAGDACRARQSADRWPRGGEAAAGRAFRRGAAAARPPPRPAVGPVRCAHPHLHSQCHATLIGHAWQVCLWECLCFHSMGRKRTQKVLPKVNAFCCFFWKIKKYAADFTTRGGKHFPCSFYALWFSQFCSGACQKEKKDARETFWKVLFLQVFFDHSLTWER